ncbi:MAG: nicotinate-nucleotide adenylyltransferase [Halorhodospira sp.]
MSQPLRTIGLLGGTFDPIHYGHLRPAEEVREALLLSELRLIPARIPPHRAQPRVGPEQRAELVRLAVADHPSACIDERELHRDGPSYTVDTLAELRAELSDVTLCLILGYDTFLGLPMWSRWRQLLEQAHIVVTERPGVRGAIPAALHDEVVRRQSSDPADLRRSPAGHILFQAVTPVDISATGIRRALALGQSVRYLMPEAVRRRIAEAGLYGYSRL